MVVSALHQLESVIIIYIYTHTYPLPLVPPFPHIPPLCVTHRLPVYTGAACVIYGLPVLHPTFPLVISFTYDSVYLPLSQFVLPSPPLCPALWTLCPFSTSESLFLLSILWNRIVFPAAAAAAAKSRQSCPTLCDPIDGSPPGSLVPGILQARTLEWVAISVSNAWKWKVKVKSLSLVRLFAIPWTVAHQAPPSMGFSRQECWTMFFWKPWVK